jgi:hypothetical protein
MVSIIMNICISVSNGAVPFGTQALVDQMKARLKGADLGILWIATQQRDDQSKINGTVSGYPENLSLT